MSDMDEYFYKYLNKHDKKLAAADKKKNQQEVYRSNNVIFAQNQASLPSSMEVSKVRSKRISDLNVNIFQNTLEAPQKSLLLKKATYVNKMPLKGHDMFLTHKGGDVLEESMSNEQSQKELFLTVTRPLTTVNSQKLLNPSGKLRVTFK
jgi:hypothetical protein